MTPLSPNFTLEELTYSATALRWGLNNTPTGAEVANLRSLCLGQLEPVRTLLGVPIHVDSGYRNSVVNSAVGSTSEHSDHLDGNAADIIPMGFPLRAAFDLIRASGIPFKQLIIECGAWLHISRGVFKQEALLASKDALGRWVYLPA